MSETRQTQVLIIGAGPVGLTLAAELASRGIHSLIIETRRPAEAPNVRCNHVASRSMEIFRRLGVAGKLRQAGLPDDYPNDVSYRTTTIGQEITRILIPGRATRFTDTSGPDGWWPTPEPPHRINQLYLEPILFEHVAQIPLVQIMNRCRFESVEQQDDGVLAKIRNLDSDEQFTVAAQYMVGCDGGKSVVRKAIGAQFFGDAIVQRVQSTWIEAPDLITKMVAPPAWAMFSLNPRRSGNLYAIDGKQSWLIHNYLRDDEPDFDSVDRDWAIRQILGVDEQFSYRVISKEDWIGRRLIADKFREDHIFLAGDAAHIWV
ncbi:MAG: FAD-dependent monooxygenase, partial [Burkholderiaceae bacterium]